MIRLKRLYAHNFKQLQEIELRFPDHARVLVQGKNEAGKSTLFEAIFFALFGSALATETGARGLDDLIRYDVEKARVELDVQFGARVLSIKRTIVRGKSNTWELDVANDGQPLEEIRGNTAVNKRLVAELGFDGDALLNTCFVEQKKLEKLEGLSRAKREESLAKLLNLDQLVALEGDLKIRAEDKQLLDRLKKRADLADIQADLPAQELALRAVEEKLQLIDLSRSVSGAVEETRAVAQLDATIQTQNARRAHLAQQVERIDALKQAMLAVKEARDAVERTSDNAREIERLKQEQNDAQRAADSAPQLVARANTLARLERRLKRLDSIRATRDAAQQRAAQIAIVETRARELDATITREEASLAQAEARVREYAIGDALGEWIAARNELSATTRVATDLADKRSARDDLARRFRTETYGFAAVLLALTVATIAAPASVLSLAGASAVTTAIMFGAIFFVLAAIVVIMFALRAMTLWRDLSRAAEALGQVEGEAHAEQSAVQARQARVQNAEARLAQMDVAIPETVDLAHTKRVMIAREMENKTADELRADAQAARERLTNARAVLGELQKQNAFAGEPRVAREQCERVAQKANAILARGQARLHETANTSGVAPEANALQRARFQIDAELAQIQRRVNDATRFAQDIARREQQTQTFFAQAREAYERARVVKPDAAEWNLELEAGNYNGFGKELRAEYDALGGEAVVKQARDLEGELGRRQGERATRARNAAILVAQVRDLVGAANLSETPTLAELEQLAARVQSLDLGDEAALRLHQRELVGRVHSLRDRQTQLARELAWAGEPLDPAACRAEWQDKMRESLVRERGVEIVSLARRRIVQKVLPATMDYMRRILPTITRDRYHDAQLDAESYKIQVWDERANAFKEKNIFSGGTRDQFSLALRLAFALATMPQERGSAPSFIFLDEPLGSFDDERADALIYLLTEGEIARAFDQIFLISHVHVDERLFTHRVVMENGRVAATDLPVNSEH
ncbi:MAG: AAA family ATPase [Chloroflexi bacterium]|nr:AAA family ATPase [Chloroflexota bacterium]